MKKKVSKGKEQKNAKVNVADKLIYNWLIKIDFCLAAY